MNETDRLVFLTIVYSSHFSFALNKGEILQRLPISASLNYLFNRKKSSFKKILASQQKINNSLKKLIQLSLIQTDGEYFYLEKKDLLVRKNRIKFYDFKKKEALIFVNLAKKIPFVKAVALTGSSAVGNSLKNDDLDFMIICQKNTLWLTRFMLIILTKLKNKQPGLNKPSSWCINLFLDEGDLILDPSRQSLYEAYEILQMQFLFDRGGYKKLFLNANAWVQKYLFYYYDSKLSQYKQKKSLSLVNCLFFFVQKTYRKFVFGQENFSLSLTQAFFNDINFKNKLLISLERKIAFKE
jgi:hypothetical protein